MTENKAHKCVRQLVYRCSDKACDANYKKSNASHAVAKATVAERNKHTEKPNEPGGEDYLYKKTDKCRYQSVSHAYTSFRLALTTQLNYNLKTDVCQYGEVAILSVLRGEISVYTKKCHKCGYCQRRASRDDKLYRGFDLANRTQKQTADRGKRGGKIGP